MEAHFQPNIPQSKPKSQIFIVFKKMCLTGLENFCLNDFLGL
jgi:hypothetical protein